MALARKPIPYDLKNPATSEPDYSDDERDFMVAMDQYKRKNNRPFPTWREVLNVLWELGWRKVPDFSKEIADADA